MATFISNLNVLAHKQLLPAQVVAATTTGSGVDMQAAFEEALVVFNVGTLTDGGYTLKIQDSADNSTFTDLSGAALAEVTTANDVASYKLRIRGYRRYIRVVITETTSGATGGAMSVDVLGVQNRT